MQFQTGNEGAELCAVYLLLMQPHTATATATGGLLFTPKE